MSTPFPQSSLKGGRWIALGAAALVSLGLFLVIPLTQYLNEPSKEILDYRQMVIAMPPPPPPIPPSPLLDEVKDAFKPKPPKMKQQLTEVPVQQLALSLNPGMGVALAAGVPSMPAIGKVDLTAEIEKIFNFDELARVPTLLNARMIRADFPRELARQGVKQARVELEILIDKRGRVRVDRVLSSSHSHPKLKEAARKAASQARFSITKVDGRAVVVRGRFPITLQAPRR